MGTFDDTIVNPAKLENSLREAVCQQCHLQGQQRVLHRGREMSEFRPGLPFDMFACEFVAGSRTGAGKFVGSVEQMYASQCFQKGTGAKKMGCISCHDPHSVPTAEKKVEFYRGRCMTCHQEKGCSVPVETRLDAKKQDNCIACHMPPTGTNLNHASVNDHRILRRPDTTAKPDPTALAERDLVPFHQSNVVSKLIVDRDFGIALVRQSNRLPTPEARPLAEKAQKLLDSALATDASDVPARESLGSALWFLGRLEAAFDAYERVLASEPKRETTLHLIAQLSQRLGRPGAARSYAERVLAVNPMRWEYHQTLARACMELKDWRTALKESQEVVTLHGTEWMSHQTIVLCHMRLGDKARASKAFETLLGLNPPKPEELRKWFAQISR